MIHKSFVPNKYLFIQKDHISVVDSLRRISWSSNGCVFNCVGITCKLGAKAF